VFCRSPDQLLEEGEEEILVLDIVKGAVEPIIIDDIRQIRTRPIATAHDMDLGYFLSLMANMGQEKKVRIIGIPEQGNAAAIATKVRGWL
jgi:hypothetical protein